MNKKLTEVEIDKAFAEGMEAAQYEFRQESDGTSLWVKLPNEEFRLITRNAGPKTCPYPRCGSTNVRRLTATEWECWDCRRVW